MENTTKALLIAAAILIVIILVALSVKIFSSSEGVTEQADGVSSSISIATQDATKQIQTSFDVQRETHSGGDSTGVPEGSDQVGGDNTEIPDQTGETGGDISVETNQDYINCGFYDNSGKTMSWTKFKEAFPDAFNETSIIKNIDSSTSYFSSDNRVSGRMEIPDDIYELQEGCFYSCNQINYINLPYTISRLENGVFGACSLLQQITFYNSITYIAPYAFIGCNNLKDIWFNGSVSDWYSINGVEEAFRDLGEITVHCNDGNKITI